MLPGTDSSRATRCSSRPDVRELCGHHRTTEGEPLTGTPGVGVISGQETSLLSSLPLKQKAVDPKKVDMVIFHAMCPDGFAAAFAAYLRLGKDCEYVGLTCGNKRVPENVDGKTIAILDFSFDKDTMDDLKKRAKGVVVLDHHASAQEDLASLPDENKALRYITAKDVISSET
ncbi:unnamed protein product [Cladocopium goreaui]|uniref:DHH family phosphoesterase n=1 Tax=Cladocopium goreaui TaxID=2562237 RepID=A0A9P1CRP0_9DINO|nr:unnamed protein product [Cladocopium goreaui]